MQHVFNQANAVVDALAKQASLTQCSAVFLIEEFRHLDSRINGLIALDQRQFSYIRVRWLSCHAIFCTGVLPPIFWWIKSVLTRELEGSFIK